MAQKNGVGIWNHCRTTDRADGFETSFRSEGRHYRAKLYWAPADFTSPDKGGKRAYVVVWVSLSGKMNRFGNYEDEVRYAGYIGDEVKRRNWNRLCEIADGIGFDEVIGMAAEVLRYHEAMLAHGCAYEHGAYYFPAGTNVDEFMAAVRAELAGVDKAA